MSTSNTIQPTRLAILGSTGSIGTQALDVVRANPTRFQVELLSANSNADLLIAQGQISKAKKMYEALCLKFPEKSLYFAKKIKQLQQ